MAHRFFSQIVAEDDTENESDDVVGFVPRSEDLTLEYDTCVDISSVIDNVVEDIDRSDRELVVEAIDDAINDASSVGDVSSAEEEDSLTPPEKDITSTIVKEVDSSSSSRKSRDLIKSRDLDPSRDSSAHSIPVNAGHVHSHTITVTTAPRLRPDLSDSEMSGISDESEVEVEAVVDVDAPLTDVINGIVRERRKQAKREARKRAKTTKRNKGYKISKPHKKHEHNAKELEAIEKQLQE
ncbi:hypothetical protein CJU89_6243 [Yarrowia sp. B02]|nr:hypothetical protein CJU89_6243 [Yarrowia sp. B02]